MLMLEKYIKKADQIKIDINSINKQIFGQQKDLNEVQDSLKKIIDEYSAFCDEKANQLNDGYSKVQQLENTYIEQEKKIQELLNNKETQMELLDNQSLKKYNLTQEIRKIDIKLIEFNKFSDLVNNQLNYFCEQLQNTSNSNQLVVNFDSQELIEQDILDIQEQMNLLRLKQQKDIDYLKNIIKQLEQSEKSYSKEFISSILSKFKLAKDTIQSLVQSINKKLLEIQAGIKKLDYWPQNNRQQTIQQLTKTPYLIIQKFDEQIREKNKAKLMHKREIRNIKFLILIDYNIKMRNSNVEDKIKRYFDLLQQQFNVNKQQLINQNYDKNVGSGEEDLIQEINEICKNQQQKDRLKEIQNEFSEIQLKFARLLDGQLCAQISNKEQLYSILQQDQFISLLVQYKSLSYREIMQLQEAEIITLNNKILSEKQKSINSDLQINQEFSELQQSYSIFFRQEINILKKKILILSKEEDQVDYQQIQTQNQMISNMNTILNILDTFKNQQERNISDIAKGINILEQYFDKLQNSSDEFLVDLNQDICFSSIQQLNATYNKLLNNKSKINSQIYLTQIKYFQNSKEILQIAKQQYTKKKLELDDQINLCKRVKITKIDELKQCKANISKTKLLIKRLLFIIIFKQDEQKQKIKEFNTFIDEIEDTLDQYQEVKKQKDQNEDKLFKLQISMEISQKRISLLNLQLKAYKFMEKIKKENALEEQNTVPQDNNDDDLHFNQQIQSVEAKIKKERKKALQHEKMQLGD